MNRAEHLTWAKNRALAYVRQGSPAEAVASMLSDLSKHPDLNGHSGIVSLLLIETRNPKAVKRWIEGFR